MAELFAKDIMTKKVITINKNASISELSEILIKNNISGSPVVDDDGNLVGIVTEGDIIVQDTELLFPKYFKLLDSIIYLESLNKFKKNLKKHLGTKVEDIMTTKVKVVKEDTPVGNIADVMVKNNINRVPVVDEENNIVGIITRADIIKSMLKK